MSALLSQLAGNQLAGFILVLARVTPLFFIAPLFSSTLIPPRVRGIVAVAIAIGLTPIAMHGQHVPTDALTLAALVIEGLLVGLGFAFSLAVLLAAIESAGSLIDVISGFSYGNLINPMNGQDSAVISRFYSLVGTLIFLVIGGDAWTLRGMARTFQLVPLTRGPQLTSLLGGTEHVFATIFTAALEVAAPVLVALLITDVAFGVVSRVVPQLNVFAVGFPTKVAVTLLVVGASLPFFANWINEQLSVSVGAGPRRAACGVMANEDRTEKATPKHRKRARDKGQVARSSDLGGSVVLVAGLLAISMMGSRIVDAGAATFREMLGDISHPARFTTAAGLNGLMHSTLSTIALTVGPVAGTCLVAGVLASVAQVGFAPSLHPLKPDFRRINPASGLKNLLGPNLPVEIFKATAKVAVVAAVAAMALLPGLHHARLHRRHPAGRARRDVRPAGARGGPERSLRLCGDRTARLRLEALSPRAAAEDDQAAGQRRDPPVRDLSRGQGWRSAAARCRRRAPA